MEQRRVLQGLVGELRRRGMLVDTTEPPEPETAIGGVKLDARIVRPGDVFVALSGTRRDGHAFVPDAVAKGAAAVLVQAQLAEVHVPQIVVTDTRRAAAVASAWFNGFPALRLGVVGVTGTDGKSSTCWMIHHLLEAAGHPSGMLTTVKNVVAGEDLGNIVRMTTPDSPELQAYLGAMASGGDEFAVIEVSSHGLAQHRTDEIGFDAAVLTNIGHEHLDYHGTMAAYRAAKRRLFESLTTPFAPSVPRTKPLAVVNADDRHGLEFAEAGLAAGAEVKTYGFGADGDVRATDVRSSADGTRFVLVTDEWSDDVSLPLIGQFNVSNALAAVAAVGVAGMSRRDIIGGLATVSSVPGRMQQIEAGQPFAVVVDYAHTPQALSTILKELAPIAEAGGGKVICLFGSAGERDRQKRTEMGRIAATMASTVVVTEEDPRSEDSREINQEIAAGARMVEARERGAVVVIDDRRDAVREAIRAAQPGDVVLLAGKGHEQTIDRGEVVVSWDEVGAARDALRELGFD